MGKIDGGCAGPAKAKPKIGWAEWLQSLKNEAEKQRMFLQQEGKSTNVVDTVIEVIDQQLQSAADDPHGG